jgi:hypothetical protein
MNNGCEKCPIIVGSYDDAHKLVTGHHPRCSEYQLMHPRPFNSLELLERLIDEVKRLRGEMRERTVNG